MASGIARIESVGEGVGEYTITQVFWNVTDEAIDDEIEGFQNVTATDPLYIGERAVGDIVMYTYNEMADGGQRPLISDLLGLPTLPTAEGTYWVKLVVDGAGTPTVSWGDTTTVCP